MIWESKVTMYPVVNGRQYGLHRTAKARLLGLHRTAKARLLEEAML